MERGRQGGEQKEVQGDELGGLRRNCSFNVVGPLGYI